MEERNFKGWHEVSVRGIIISLPIGLSGFSSRTWAERVAETENISLRHRRGCFGEPSMALVAAEVRVRSVLYFRRFLIKS